MVDLLLVNLPSAFSSYAGTRNFKFYLNPRYLLRRVWLSIKNRTLFLDIYFGLQTFFPKVFKSKNIFSEQDDQ